MTPFFACVFYLFVFSRVRCLELEEAGQFFNSRRYGGFVSVSESENSFIIVSNGLPDHAPDSLTSQPVIPRNNVFSVLKKPTIAENPGCLPKGPIGITRTGVVIFNPLNLEGQNAVEGDTAEQLDQCNGHPDAMGVYHYHALPKHCLYKGREDELIGVARDGFPIYGPMASDLKREVLNSDLDKCHGRFVNGQYRYHATSEFPYFMGCLRGNIARGMDELMTACNETSAFDEKWGYLCACERPNTLERQGQGRFPPGMGVNEFPRPVGFVPGQGQNQFGRRQMLPGSIIGGQIPGQVMIGPNGQSIRTGNQIQIGPNGQIISNENQLQIGLNGQIIGRGNQIQVGANRQIINPESQLQGGPNGNPIQMPAMTGPAAIQRQGTLGLLPTKQLGDGSEQPNIIQGQSQIPRPLGFLPTQQPTEGDQISVGPNGQIVNNRNPIQMPIPTGPAAVQGQGPMPLGFLPVQQQGDGEQISVGPNGQIVNNRNPIQMPIPTGPAAIQGQGPLGFLPTQQQSEEERASIGSNRQLISSGSQIQINPNGNPIQMPLTTGPAAIQGQGQRPLGFLPVQQQGEVGPFSGNPGQGQIPRPIGFLPNAIGRPSFSIPQNGEQLNSEQPRFINSVVENGDQTRNVNLVTENGEQTRVVNGIQQMGEQPLPIFVNGVAQNPDQPMTRLVRTQNGQVIPVMVNSGSQNGQTLTVPRIARPMGNSGMFQRRPFGKQSPPFLTQNSGMISPTNSPVPVQSPMVDPPLGEPNANGMMIRQGKGHFQPIDSPPSSSAAVQGQTQTIEGLEILDKSTQEYRKEAPNDLFRKPFEGQRRRLPGFGKYGRYRLFNMYLENSL